MTGIETLLFAVADSQASRFWLQLLILAALVVLGCVMLYDRFKVMQHKRVIEAGEDFDMALDAKKALNISLAQRMTSLEGEVASARTRESELRALVAQMESDHKAEIDGLRRRFEAEIAELRGRLEDYECVVAPGCPNRKRRPTKAA
jgi:hypothetical protein